VEIAGTNVNTISETQEDGETWGLAVCQMTGLVVTCADDNKILAYDTTANKAVSKGIINEKKGPERQVGKGASTMSECPPNQCARALSINSKNGHVAVAINDGEVSIRAGAKDLGTTVSSIKESREWIEVLQYSPCGLFLAVGGHDCKVTVYSVSDYKKVSVFEKHSAFITGLDWSCDSQSIHSVSASYEILFSEAATGNFLPDGCNSLKDEAWASWTCRIGWPVQGLYPSGVNGAHIHGVERAHGGKVIATGDEWRLTNLQRFPNQNCTKPKSYVAHSEFVTRTAWSADDQFLYTVGGGDRMLVKWKVC